MASGEKNDPPVAAPGAGLLVRGTCGGVLMGLANLVPGISGGTMLLATGIYRSFVEAVADLSRLRFRARSLFVVGLVALAALAAVVLLAGPMKELVETRQWVMYSLFIGLTLGGVPLVWRQARPVRAPFWMGVAGGFALMVLIKLTTDVGARDGGVTLLVLAGVAGAMILPGISGAYLLLVLGQYERILGAVRDAKDGARASDWSAVAGTFDVVVPVGIGVVLGVVVVSNLVRALLRRCEQATLGVLMGLLCGSVLGLYPFEYTPQTGARVAVAATLVLAGYLTTRLIDRFGTRAARAR